MSKPASCFILPRIFLGVEILDDTRLFGVVPFTSTNKHIVELHRKSSNLRYCTMELVFHRAADPPHERLCTRATVDLDTYPCLQGSKELHVIEATTELLAFSDDLKTHSPFVICMIANITIAHLSACKCALQDQL